jgi:hypothetical protein
MSPEHGSRQRGSGLDHDQTDNGSGAVARAASRWPGRAGGIVRPRVHWLPLLLGWRKRGRDEAIRTRSHPPRTDCQHVDRRGRVLGACRVHRARNCLIGAASVRLRREQGRAQRRFFQLVDAARRPVPQAERDGSHPCRMRQFQHKPSAHVPDSASRLVRPHRACNPTHGRRNGCSVSHVGLARGMCPRLGGFFTHITCRASVSVGAVCHATRLQPIPGSRRLVAVDP